MNGYIVKVVPRGHTPTDSVERLLRENGYEVLGVSPSGKVHVQLNGGDIAVMLESLLRHVYDVRVEG